LAIGLGAALSACTPIATYPPVQGSDTFEPWVYPMPQLMAESLRYVRIRLTPDQTSLFNLPPAVPEWIWDQVARDVGNGAQPMTADGEIALSVQQVRVNGGKAEVDIAYPTPEGLYQLVTIGLRTDPFQPPRVVFENRWRIPVDPPASNWPNRQLPDYSDYEKYDGGVGAEPPPAEEPQP